MAFGTVYFCINRLTLVGTPLVGVMMKGNLEHQNLTMDQNDDLTLMILALGK